MIKPKRNRLKELWFNRPWVYIPKIHRSIQLLQTKNFKHIIECARLNWTYSFKHGPHIVVYKECYKCACRGCAHEDCMKSRCAVCDHCAAPNRNYGRPVVVCGRTKVIMEGFDE